MPAITPIGVLIKVQEPTIIRLPRMALDSPPPSLSGPGVLLMNKSKLSTEKPL